MDSHFSVILKLQKKKAMAVWTVVRMAIGLRLKTITSRKVFSLIVPVICDREYFFDVNLYNVVIHDNQ